MKLFKPLYIALFSFTISAGISACSASPAASTSSPESIAVSSTAAALAATSSSAASSEESTAGTEAKSGFPIRMKHAYGETEISEKPARIVTLDWNNADPLLALGIAPVGSSMANFGSVGENGLLPWTTEAFQKLNAVPNVFSDLDGYDFEAIAAAKPDIILATYSGMDEENYRRLSEIAPTIPYKEKPWFTTWRDQTIEAAEAVGLKAEGEALVKETDAFISETINKYPKIRGKKAAFCYFNPADLGSFYVYRQTDPRGAYLTDLGFRFPESVEAAVTDKDAFFALISSELALDTIHDIDVIITYGDAETLAALQTDAVLSQVPAIKEGRVVLLDSTGDLAAACNPSVLSVRSRLVPYMDAINAVFE